MRKKYLIFSFVLLSISMGILIWYNLSKVDFYHEKVPDIEISFYGDKDQYVLVKPKIKGENLYKRVFASSNYIVTYEEKRENYENDDEGIHSVFKNGEFAYFYTYDLNDNAKKEKIDLSKLLNADKLTGEIIFHIPITYNGNDYIFIVLSQHIKGQSKNQHQSRLVNIKTKRLEKVPKELKNPIYEKGFYFEPIEHSGLQSTLLKNSGLHMGFNYSSSYIKVDDNIEEKSLSNLSDTNLAQETPELAKALQNGGVLFTRSEMVDTKTWFNTLLHWFAPKGQDVLEVYATAEDGTKTQIKSYDEFVEWRKTHPRTN